MSADGVADEQGVPPFLTTECTICTHPKAAEIDEALLGGTAIRTVAGTFGLSRSSVHRHRQNHLSVQAIEDPDPEQRARPLSLVDVHAQLTALCDRLEKVVELSTRTRKPAAAVQAMREQRQALEAIAKIQASPELRRGAALDQLRADVAHDVGDWWVDLMVFLGQTAGLDLCAEPWRSVIAQCLRTIDAEDPKAYLRADFTGVDVSDVTEWLERRAVEQADRVEAEVQRRVEAELRRREAQTRPAIEAREIRALESGGPVWSA